MKLFLSSLLIVISASVFSVQAKEHTNTSWNALSDPKLLIKHCDAQFTRNSNQPTCVIFPDSHDQAKVFSKMLWEAWSGHTQLARYKFNMLQLNEDKVWSLWGGIGLLELENYTGNQIAVTSLLRRLKEDFLSSEKPLFIEMYEHYELWHASDNYEWARLKKLLGKYSKEKIRNDPELFFLQSTILVNNEQELELEKLLNEASPSVKKTIHYVNSMIEYTTLKYGIKELDSVIRKFAKDRPEDTKIAFSFAIQELSDNDPDVSEAALNRLYKISEASRKDVGLILSVLVILGAHKKFDESDKVLNMANFGDDVVLDDFVAYHNYMALTHLYKNKIEFYEAFNRVEKAISLAPKDTTANRLKVTIARENGRPDLALGSLRVLLEASPNYEGYRNQVIYFRNKYKTPEFESLYQRMINYH